MNIDLLLFALVVLPAKFQAQHEGLWLGQSTELGPCFILLIPILKEEFCALLLIDDGLTRPTIQMA